jgi:hypothetical protein
MSRPASGVPWSGQVVRRHGRVVGVLTALGLLGSLAGGLGVLDLPAFPRHWRRRRKLDERGRDCDDR